MIRIYEVANNVIARQKRVAAFQEVEDKSKGNRESVCIRL
jgi:hypothetical protein